MDKKPILLFAGTTEGRLLFNELTDKGVLIDVCVATEYGKEVIDEKSEHVFAKRLNIDEMKTLMQNNSYALVIDATHPYAELVTQNIKAACEALRIPYIRLLRKESNYSDVIYCENIDDAVAYLSLHEGNVLSTIGSKELNHLTTIPEFEKRIFARILPLPDAVTSCFDMGFKGSNLICMQGPFPYEMNVAMLKQYNCCYLLTKSSGNTGGFDDKIKAAKDANAKVVLIGRPTQEQGLSLEEVKEYVFHQFGYQHFERKELKTFFPFFIDISNKRVLVVGAGKIALRRIDTLLKFNCKIKVVAPEALDEITKLSALNQIEYEKRGFNPNDIDDMFIVVAATDNREVNHDIGALANSKNIYVSVADCKEECNFYFPAVIETNDTVIGVTAEGKSHKAASQMADRIRKLTRKGSEERS
ncbi:precorrin-6A reductase [Paludicola sp. MB14-C6]|uniref:precorrin-6A reductase n=1 Tax=Paludihabitans sp. MB14-C6 TaxID=3070656 RepID=UPI0027DBEAEA|nr:precorrin-6A reductase [Paludicola sp. MB14-C6]WMJ22036.1 precorrin-6A reductase [Paludicola sp. MB14-C6]